MCTVKKVKARRFIFRLFDKRFKSSAMQLALCLLMERVIARVNLRMIGDLYKGSFPLRCRP